MGEEELPDVSFEEDKKSFFKTARKAVIAGGAAFAGALGPALLVATGDGVLTVDEIVPLTVTALGIGAAAGLAVWAVRNDAPVG
ncbi:membrane protein [Microbacterium phage Alex44]|uniref:Uncharacterized protein n=2 Tax=Tinytimothyvirus alex44 TaxID=2845588 RepID=A0A3Q9RAD6_9CAUD|nr:membrane protein [Microbacterium phage Alex44]AZV01802.1 hypothetical protein SEA_ARMAWEN_40 [Microbacterium phage ArMaWen]QDF15951.1 hypothetical protein SEA_ALEX44_41 [Microbacterium phage Alex44]